ncbi:MAG: ABC transporter permease, partial [Anaerolineales bacterium]|nr:ABC transporter permease [Anaerolineales bacterium]
MLTSSLLKTTLRDAIRRPWQTGLMILGVALGVAVVIAIDLANTSANRAFTLSTEAITGKTTHQVVGTSSLGVPLALYQQMRVDWGYRLSAPVVEVIGLAPELNNQPLRILGVDAIAEAPFRNYFGGQSSFNVDLTDFYTQPNAVLIGPSLAQNYQLNLGDTFRLQINDRIETLAVVGLLQPEDEGQARALDNLVLMDVGNAQNLLAQIERLSRIDLILTETEARALA